MNSEKQFHFTTTLNYYDFGKYAYSVIYVPKKITDELPTKKYPRLRMNMLLNGMFINCALNPDTVGSDQTKHLLESGEYKKGDKIWWIMVSKRISHALNIDESSQLEVYLSVGDQDAVEVPEALQLFLVHNLELKEKWDALTPGKQRSLAHLVKTAKTRPTIDKRLDKVALILTGELNMYGK